MSSSYFLLFLLALLMVTAATTAEQNDAAFTEPTSKPLFGRNMYSRGWENVKNHPTQSTQKSRHEVIMQEADQKFNKPAAEAKATMQMGEEKRRLEDMRNAVAFSRARTMRKVGRMAEVNKPAADFAETDMQKLEKASKNYYKAGAKRVSNVQKIEGANQ